MEHTPTVSATIFAEGLCEDSVRVTESSDGNKVLLCFGMIVVAVSYQQADRLSRDLADICDARAHDRLANA